jgi:CheY-like chemotaxis protein
VALVLFLEDEPRLVQNLPSLLKPKGLDLVATTSIQEALQWFGEHTYDAVLLDTIMPPTEDMDAEALGYGLETGVEVARRMKALKPQVPVIALTVMHDPEIQRRMREAGIVDIINKPAEPDQIAEVLLRHIRRSY